MSVYPFIEAEKQNSQAGRAGNVARACALLKVSRSAYYAHTAAQAAGGTRRQREDVELLDRIRPTTPRPRAATGHRGSTPTWPTRAAPRPQAGRPGDA